MSKHPKLRGKFKARESVYPLGEFPPDIITNIGKLIVHRLAIGLANIDGDGFADIFAKAISGDHRPKPLGITDITWENCSWSAKTVHNSKPFSAKSVRLITGRNNLNKSYGVKDAFKDVQDSGSKVLDIWNERVNQSLHEFEDLRVVTLIRNMSKLEFTIFEYEPTRYIPSDYEWKMNKKENFEGYEKTTGKHVFTWQPDGSQFTVIRTVPGSAQRFKIKRHPGIIPIEQILLLVSFREDWIIRIDEDGKPTTHEEGASEEHDAGAEG